MIEKNNFNEIEGKEILNKLFNKELNSKKNILEAIEIIRPLAKEELKGEKLQEIYNIIYNSIEDMNTIVKANTIMYLKNQLKSALGIKTKRKLGEDEIEDIIKNINKLLSSGKIEYINQVKSLEKLLNVLNVKVVNYKDGFKLKNK